MDVGFYTRVDTALNRNRLEDNLAQLNSEHVKILVRVGTSLFLFSVLICDVDIYQNELVMARLRHEELEGELVRYKLLFESLCNSWPTFLMLRL